jgi:asparagine synthase (glutamine-hydrolysing)
MCGIAGFVWKDARRPADAAAVQSMCDVIAHRGPDAEGVHVEGPVGLGHRRLSILDLSEAGTQPLFTHDGRFVIVFNGEIYNYVELRAELVARGALFRTQTDTEVILEAYRAWGADCVSRFNGMWAFALYDRRERTIFFSRDRFGIKPLYLLETADALHFGSEIKAILAVRPEERVPRENYIARFLPGGLFDDGAETSFKNVTSLLPAQNAIYRVETGRLERSTYWRAEPEAFKDKYRTSDPVGMMRELLTSAVRLHLRSDVPVGSCLSGGVDSSAIVCLMSGMLDKPAHTFSGIYADAECNEEPYVNVVNARAKTIATPIRPEPNGDLIDDLRTITWHQDEPTAGPGLYTQYHVMREAGRKIKVILDGQGADELFGGYLFYFQSRLADLCKQGRRWEAAKLLLSIRRHWGRSVAPRAAIEVFPWLEPVRRLGAKLKRSGIAASVPGVASDRLAAELAAGPITRDPARSFAEQLQVLQHDQISRSSLPALLHYEDRNSMAHSIEARVPFLDYRIVEFAYATASDLKMKGSWTKWIVRKAAEPFLPKEVAWRRSKMGYPTPMSRWFRKPSERKAVEDVLFSSELRRRDVIDTGNLKAVWDQHQAGADHSWLLYRVLTLELWHRLYIDRFAAADFDRVGRRPQTPLRRSA